MRLVLDTNTLVSSILSANGAPRRLLNYALTGAYELCSSAVLLAELQNVLSRDKFSSRLHQAGLSPESFILQLHRIAYVVNPVIVPQVIQRDPDDDHVLACAVAATADCIVSGDKDLFSIGPSYEGIPIVTTAQALEIIESRLRDANKP
jgi:uncharacterized protein